MHPAGRSVGPVTFEGEVVLGVLWVDVVNGHAPLDTAQGKAARTVGLLVREDTHTAVLGKKNSTMIALSSLIHVLNSNLSLFLCHLREMAR